MRPEVGIPEDVVNAISIESRRDGITLERDTDRVQSVRNGMRKEWREGGSRLGPEGREVRKGGGAQWEDVAPRRERRHVGQVGAEDVVSASDLLDPLFDVVERRDVVRGVMIGHELVHRALPDVLIPEQDAELRTSRRIETRRDRRWRQGEAGRRAG